MYELDLFAEIYLLEMIQDVILLKRRIRLVRCFFRQRYKYDVCSSHSYFRKCLSSYMLTVYTYMHRNVERIFPDIISQKRRVMHIASEWYKPLSD